MKRLMLIGAGSLGLARAQQFAAIDGVEMVAVASRSEQSAEKVAREIGAPLAGTDVKRIADQKNPDAVVICALNQAHYGLIKWALQRELDVFVEGPMCNTSAQAEELVDLAVQYRRIIEVGFQRRYHPTIQRARQMGQDGSMGQLIYGEVEFLWDMRPHPGQHLWYLDQAESGGMFVAHGSYGLNTLRYVLGDPSEVFAAGNNFMWHQPGMVKHDTVAATLMYESGAVAGVLASYSMPQRLPHWPAQGPRHQRRLRPADPRRPLRHPLARGRDRGGREARGVRRPDRPVRGLRAGALRPRGPAQHRHGQLAGAAHHRGDHPRRGAARAAGRSLRVERLVRRTLLSGIRLRVPLTRPTGVSGVPGA